MTVNPFPGPRPYRAGDRARFFAREGMARALAGSVMAHACLTVFGPSGAGKSSLMQAAVIPQLVDDYDLRVVRVDTWPEISSPIAWVNAALYDQLDLGSPPAGVAAGEALISGVERAALHSPQPILVYLDQMEQPLFAGRDPAELAALIAALDQLVALPLPGLHLVLSLREDYVGPLHDRMRDRRRLTDYEVRVGHLTVGALVDAVCRAAATGEPPQAWSREEMRRLMLEVRVPGQAPSEEAEAQAAYAQIVCRALFEERAESGRASETTDAESIVQRYLEATLADLGALRGEARRLLEDQLITAYGGRTVRTESELALALPREAIHVVLERLERAAILHAEEHQGSRYFELGHDWLAKRLFELRKARERAEELARLRESEARKLAESKRLARRRLGVFVAVAVTITAALVITVLWALERAATARRTATMAAARQLLEDHQLAAATMLLLDVKAPENVRDWDDLAMSVLAAEDRASTLRGHSAGVWSAAWSPDGESIVTASADGTARLWEAGLGLGTESIVLPGAGRSISAVAWSPDGDHFASASSEGVLLVWSRKDCKGLAAKHRVEPVVLLGHTNGITSLAWSPNGQRLATASVDRTARVWSPSGVFGAVVLGGKEEKWRWLFTEWGADDRHADDGHQADVVSVAWSPDGMKIVTASLDGSVRIWDATGGSPPLVLSGNTLPLVSVAWSPDGKRIVAAAQDATAKIWDADVDHLPIVLRGHEGAVLAAAWSPDGKRIVTASTDKRARIWSAEGGAALGVLEGHDLAVVSAAWSPDGKKIITASSDRTARVWSADGRGPAKILKILHGHTGPLLGAAWGPDGQRVVTSSADGTARVWPVTTQAIRERLREFAKGKGSAACLTPEQRRTYLDESADEADRASRDCRRRVAALSLM